MTLANGNLTWEADSFALGGLRFIQDWSEAALTRPAEFPEFILMKLPDNVETYLRVLAGSRKTGCAGSSSQIYCDSESFQCLTASVLKGKLR